MTKLLIFYNFVAITIITFAGFANSTTPAHLISAALFAPVMVYFWLLVSPKPAKVISNGNQLKQATVDKLENVMTILNAYQAPLTVSRTRLDQERRQFVKLIGGASLSVLMMSLFSGKAQGAFFGSVPGPGTISIKDGSGNKIDPAIRTPTDGYKISQIDDLATPEYYGFVNNEGAWFIMKEGSDGSYRYARGASAFSTNWTNRLSLSYDYFDTTF